MIATMADCPKLGGHGAPLVEGVMGHCVFVSAHQGDCVPLGGHNPLTVLELAQERWSKEPTTVTDDGSKEWLYLVGGGGSTWLRDQEDRREAATHIATGG